MPTSRSLPRVSRASTEPLPVPRARIPPCHRVKLRAHRFRRLRFLHAVYLCPVRGHTVEAGRAKYHDDARFEMRYVCLRDGLVVHDILGYCMRCSRRSSSGRAAVLSFGSTGCIGLCILGREETAYGTGHYEGR